MQGQELDGWQAKDTNQRVELGFAGIVCDLNARLSILQAAVQLVPAVSCL